MKEFVLSVGHAFISLGFALLIGFVMNIISYGIAIVSKMIFVDIDLYNIYAICLATIATIILVIAFKKTI